MLKDIYFILKKHWWRNMIHNMKNMINLIKYKPYFNQEKQQGFSLHYLNTIFPYNPVSN